MVNFGKAPHDSDDVQDLWYALKEAGFTDATGENPSVTVDTDETELNVAIQDFIDALEGAAYTDNLPQGGEHLKARGYGLQPDGDLVGEMATGELFRTEEELAAGETFTSDWYDTDGFSSLEIFVQSSVVSKIDGVKIQFTRNAQATTPTVDAETIKSYQEFYADRGFKIFKEEANLDGFRFVYENNSEPTTDFTIIATAKTAVALDGANYVAQNTLGDNQVRVGNDETGEGLKIGTPTSLFGDLATISRKTILDITSSLGTSTLRDELNTTGSGSIAQDPDPTTGEIELSTGTTSGSDVNLTTSEYGRYTPGYSAQAGMGIRIIDPANFDNGEARWGYFNGSDGFYFGFDGSQPDGNKLFVARLRNGNESNRVYRENWNREGTSDVFDREFGVENGAIYQIDFSWYGYGIVLFSIVDQTANDLTTLSPRQQTVPVHALTVQNETSVSDPNLPIKARVDNGSSTDDNRIRVGGRQFSVFGERSSEARSTSQHVNTVSVDETAWTFLQSWRRKTPAQANAKLNVDSFDTIQTGDTRYAVLINPNISGTNYGTPELTDPDETLIEVSTVGSFDGLGNGTKIYETMAAGGGGRKGAGAQSTLNANFGQDIEIVLVARGVDASSTVDITARFLEDW